MGIHQAFLEAVNDKLGKWTGEFKCTVCGEKFRYNPEDKDAVSISFTAHKASKHLRLRSRV